VTAVDEPVSMPVPRTRVWPLANSPPDPSPWLGECVPLNARLSIVAFALNEWLDPPRFRIEVFDSPRMVTGLSTEAGRSTLYPDAILMMLVYWFPPSALLRASLRFQEEYTSAV